MKITMMIFASIINERKGKTSPVIPDRKRKMTKTKRKEINASIDVTLERTHTADGGSSKTAARQIETQWIRYRYARTDSVRFFLTLLARSFLAVAGLRMPYRVFVSEESLQHRKVKDYPFVTAPTRCRARLDGDNASHAATASYGATIT